MEFTIRPATPEDVPGILQIMEESVAVLEKPEWFMADDRAYIAAHIDGPGGFCMLAVDEAGAPAAYFTVKLAGAAPDALGRYLGMEEAALLRTAQMDSCCVRPACRGHSLEGRLIAAAEDRLADMPYDTYLGTVHPDNAASLYSGLHRGYTVAATVHCYGGKLRHIVRKQKNAGGTPLAPGGIK